MRKYIKQRILNIKSNLSYDQKEHSISTLYDIMDKRKYSRNVTGQMIAETIVTRMKELQLLLNINEKEFLARKKDNE